MNGAQEKRTLRVPRITVVTLAFGHLPYFAYTASINRQYCARHRYRFVITEPDAQALRSPVWYKVRAVREELTRSDYVLFLDADAYFITRKRTIEQAIDDHLGDAALMIGSDRRDKTFAWSDIDANTGVFLVKNCRRGFEILDEWWSSGLLGDRHWLWTWPAEQGAFNEYVRCGVNARWINTIFYSHLNGMDGTFIRHLVGCSDETRLEHMREQVHQRQFLGTLARQFVDRVRRRV